MGITQQLSASPRKLSLEEGAEEGLPLYEEFQHSEGSNDGLPHEKSKPMEVSDFLVRLLIDSRGMSTDGARRVAALWTKGTGQELRSFPPQMYFEIFGSEDGWMVYREVHMALHREKSKGFWYRKGAFVLLAFALCFEAIMTGLGVAGNYNYMGLSENVGVLATLAAALGGLPCMAAFFNAILIEKGEKAIESTLSRAREKYEPPRS